MFFCYPILNKFYHHNRPTIKILKCMYNNTQHLQTGLRLNKQIKLSYLILLTELAKTLPSHHAVVVDGISSKRNSLLTFLKSSSLIQLRCMYQKRGFFCSLSTVISFCSYSNSFSLSARGWPWKIRNKFASEIKRLENEEKVLTSSTISSYSTIFLSFTTLKSPSI